MEQDDVSANANDGPPEKDDRRKSELSENIKHLECIFATNGKGTPTTTTTTSISKDELDSTKETDNQSHEDVLDLEEILNIEHPLEKNEEEGIEDKTDFVKDEKAEDVPAEKCETESQNGSDKVKEGDEQSNKTSGDQIDHITGNINHIHRFDLFLNYSSRR